MFITATPTGGSVSFYATRQGEQVLRGQIQQAFAIMNAKKVDLEPYTGKFLDVKV